ncbi:MarR family transcriptional regulator [uncultured Roseobacter sp.]|uniref:MarR family winged helix-turn-helix transcriptional regulator n=1 Tax=uncultured Roseobacter sp. TaxID=114847 RepID=UPI002616FE6A|nr:MarR family transcriptional regulator [uncultured Roseobacter sp.]
MTAPLPAFDLERYLPYRLTVIASQLSADLATHYKTQFGISMPEWRVLLNVGYTQSLSVRDIEKRVSLEKSKVSRAASRLEAKGYLIKTTDTRDKRLLNLTLTDKGRELLQALIPLAQAFQTELEQTLGETHDGLQDALDRLMEHGK